jgi:hypothetical protein
MSKQKSLIKAKAITFNPPVIKSFFAVLPEQYSLQAMKVVLLGNTKKEARTLWNIRNGYETNRPLRKGWKMVVIEAKNV